MFLSSVKNVSNVEVVQSIEISSLNCSSFYAASYDTDVTYLGSILALVSRRFRSQFKLVSAGL